MTKFWIESLKRFFTLGSPRVYRPRQCHWTTLQLCVVRAWVGQGATDCYEDDPRRSNRRVPTGLVWANSRSCIPLKGFLYLLQMSQVRWWNVFRRFHLCAADLSMKTLERLIYNNLTNNLWMADKICWLFWRLGRSAMTTKRRALANQV